MQDNVTASPLDAWSSDGVFTVMEETSEGAGGEILEKEEGESHWLGNEETEKMGSEREDSHIYYIY